MHNFLTNYIHYILKYKTLYKKSTNNDFYFLYQLLFKKFKILKQFYDFLNFIPKFYKPLIFVNRMPPRTT